MKKVLLIAPYPYLPYSSGGQKFIAQFLEWLGKSVDLSVISTANNDFSLAKSYRGIPMLKNSFSRYWDRSLVRKISGLIQSQQFDTVIWEHPYFSWLAFRIRKKTGVQTIIHTHNIEHLRFRSTHRWWWRILRRYEKKCFQKADKIFFITNPDKEFAIRQWGIDSAKCIDLPYGIDISSYPTDRKAAHEEILAKHGIPSMDQVLLFSGALSYPPNREALQVIFEQIHPQLQKAPEYRYKILICGKDLPEEFQSKQHPDVIYAGFVTNIDEYCKAASIVLNPVQSGGGIKTKMVEGIAYGATVVSTATGSAGMDPSICGNRLVIVPDNDWDGFVRAILSNGSVNGPTPQAFYDYYYWGNIIRRMLEQLHK